MIRYIYFLILLSISLASFSQGISKLQEKSIIDFSAIEKWPGLGDGKISSDGKYISYVIHNRPLGGSTKVVQSVDLRWKKEFVDIDRSEFTSDSHFVVLKQKDSVLILCLGSNRTVRLPNVGRYELFTKDKVCWLAYQKTTKDAELVLRNLNNGQEERFESVIEFQFNSAKSILVWQSETGNDQNTVYKVCIMNLENGQQQTIIQDLKAPARNLIFNNHGNIFLYTTDHFTAKDTLYDVHCYELALNKDKVIKKSRNPALNYVFDKQGEQMTCFDEDMLWYYRKGTNQMVQLANNDMPGIDKNLALYSKESILFSLDGEQILFYLLEKENKLPKPSEEDVKVDVWHYRDKNLQSVQLMPGVLSQSVYLAAINIADGKLFRIEKQGQKLISDFYKAKNYMLTSIRESDSHEWWQSGSVKEFYLICLKDGSKSKVNVGALHMGSYLQISPNGDYLLYYDPLEKGYFSYSIVGGTIRNLTKSLNISWKNERAYKYFNVPNPYYGVNPFARGIAGWTEEGNSVWVYDSNDIWKLDPSGNNTPVNMTKGYGKRNNLRFEYKIENNDFADMSNQKSWILDVFNEETKESGLAEVNFGKDKDFRMLTLGPYCNHIQKAKYCDIWLIQRNNFTDAPNLVWTKNFKHFTRLTDLQPQKEYNWYTTELVNWKLPSGDTCQGLLFKPEHLDPSKKYPLIFNYYESSTDGAFAYCIPGLSAGSNINVPYFVSRGYLVFMPDIHYKMGHPGKSALEVVTTAATELCKRSYVDKKRLGLAGHSWGGYETNYIVAHSNLFAAAAEGAGPSDFISDYNAIDGVNGIGFSRQWIYEMAQCRIGATLWQAPELYMENSPVLKADQVTTPLLMLHNKLDTAVPWFQGIELFTALRRLGKKAWMLQYDGEGHSLSNKENIKDYTVRLTQFFDHYLKDAPPPRWMTEGIRASRKGIDSGLELDTTGAVP